MKFDDITGRRNKQKVLEWFNNGKPKRKILILQGVSGNGKTLLIRSLAESIGYELQEITSDYDNKDNIIKSINTSIYGKKIILVDDFDTFNVKSRDILYNIIDISIFPVVVTCTHWKFKGSIFGKSQYLRIVRPLTSEIVDLLHNKNLPEQTVNEIAKNCNSVAEALQASITGVIPEKKDVALSNSDKLLLLSQRRLTERIEKPNVNFYFWSIHGYDKDAVKVMAEFAYYDYLCHSRFARIDPWIVNHMEAPIEKVTLKKRNVYKKPVAPSNTQNKKKATKKVKIQTNKKDNGDNGLDRFLE